MRRLALFALVLALVPFALAREDEKKDKEDKDGFVSLFDGKNLDGWVRVNNAPKTFSVKEGVIVTTGKPTGFMRSQKRYENFILEMEWMHLPPKGKTGNSGLFVWADPLPAVGTPFARAIEVQILVNLNVKDTYTSHGDIFSIWGAKCVPDRKHPKGWERCLPSEERAKGEGEWNRYRITAKDGAIKLAVNGKEVSGVSKCTPRKGYLALEAEGSECHFRNLKIKELPSSDPDEKDVCPEAKGHVTLFTGLDLEGWDAGDQKAQWRVGDNLLGHDGKAKESGKLKTQKEYGDVELILDVKVPKGGEASLGLGEKSTEINLGQKSEGRWARYVVTVKGGEATVTVNGEKLSDTWKVQAKKVPLALKAKGAVEFRNLFIRELK